MAQIILQGLLEDVILEGYEAASQGPATQVTLAVAQTQYQLTLTLDGIAGVGGESIDLSSSVSGDMFSINPLVISAGQSFGSCTLTSSSVGSRSVTVVSTTPTLSVVGSPSTAGSAGGGVAMSRIFAGL